MQGSAAAPHVGMICLHQPGRNHMTELLSQSFAARETSSKLADTHDSYSKCRLTFDHSPLLLRYLSASLILCLVLEPIFELSFCPIDNSSVFSAQDDSFIWNTQHMSRTQTLPIYIPSTISHTWNRLNTCLIQLLTALLAR
jgi:hypothetical protein